MDFFEKNFFGEGFRGRSLGAERRDWEKNGPCGRAEEGRPSEISLSFRRLLFRARFQVLVEEKVVARPKRAGIREGGKAAAARFAPAVRILADRWVAGLRASRSDRIFAEPA